MRSVALIALAGCWSSSSTAPTRPADPDVDVAVAAATLAEDCPEQDVAAMDKPPPGAVAPPAICAAGANCSPPRMACEQTSMQLRVAVTGGTGAQRVRVSHVELYDEQGRSLGALVARKPMRWSETDGAYAPWSETVDAGKSVAVTYALSAPNWGLVEGGRWRAHEHTYRLRVVVAVGANERTIEKSSITVAMLEPPVPT